MAREVGFNNINMDLILGLPGETLEDVRNTMEQIKVLNPDNLTVHSLALKRAARLNICKDEYKDFEMVNTQEHMDLVYSYCKELGLRPYYLYRQKSMAGNLENVGYAKSGKAGVYNILIMEEKQTIMALGAGATTKFVFKPEQNEPEDACCQTAKEHDSGVDFCFAKQNLMQKSKSMSSSLDMRLERVENVKDVKNYLERVDEMIERKIRKMEEIKWH